MKLSTIVASALALLSFSPSASFAEWRHAAASMGQYEGGYSASDSAVRIDYSCTGFSGNISLFISGSNAALYTISVDGEAVANVEMQPSSTPGNLFARVDYKESPEVYNSLIRSFAAGNQASLETGGLKDDVSLKGSSKISKCLL